MKRDTKKEKQRKEEKIEKESKCESRTCPDWMRYSLLSDLYFMACAGVPIVCRIRKIV
jgi:hypothetical protein